MQIKVRRGRAGHATPFPVAGMSMLTATAPVMAVVIEFGVLL